ncbi:PaaI family thioesterase [Myxococcota bacterium]|nr:PaaI family thioesterase [Myxococcota bacterium]
MAESTGADGGPEGMVPDGWGDNLGMEFVEVGPTRVVARLEAGPRHQQPYGILHGGAWCTMVEAVASYGAAQAAGTRGQAGVVGVSNHTDFLRSHSEGWLEAVGEPLHAGRRQQLWEVRIQRVSDGVLVARGQVRFQALDQLPFER